MSKQCIKIKRKKLNNVSYQKTKLFKLTVADSNIAWLITEEILDEILASEKLFYWSKSESIDSDEGLLILTKSTI